MLLLKDNLAPWYPHWIPRNVTRKSVGRPPQLQSLKGDTPHLSDTQLILDLDVGSKRPKISHSLVRRNSDEPLTVGMA